MTSATENCWLSNLHLRSGIIGWRVQSNLSWCGLTIRTCVWCPRSVLLVPATVVAGRRPQYLDHFFHRSVPLPVHLWVPVTSLPCPGRGSFLSLSPSIQMLLWSDLAPGESIFAEGWRLVHFSSQQLSPPSSEIPDGPKGLALHLGSPLQVDSNKTLPFTHLQCSPPLPVFLSSSAFPPTAFLYWQCCFCQ